MQIFALGDPHLSFTTDKPMDIFGDQWMNHTEKISQAWMATVSEEDWVLIPGDISWAMNLEEVQTDLDFLAQLPGHKILIRGNHDYWWSTISKVRTVLPPGMHALQNDSIRVADIAICGTRGWETPGSFHFDKHDQLIYEREIHRLELSLQAADPQAKERWVMLHYPPTNEKQEQSGFIDVMKRYDVTLCVYGHLHGGGHKNALLGEHQGIEFHLTACDYLDFRPLKLR